MRTFKRMYHSVRTTQRMTQSVLALRALVLRGRTLRPPSHLKKKKGERGGSWLTRQRTSKMSLFALGARDVNGLSDARVRIQPR